MALTLLQQAIDNRNAVTPQAGAVIKTLNQISPVFRLIPMKKIDLGMYDFERDGVLPNIGWRGMNQGWQESTGTTTPFREYLKIMGGEAFVDSAILRTSPRKGADTMKKQMRLKLTAAANEWERAFFEGSELTDPDEMVGLRNRIPTGNQLVLQASGGGTLTLAKFDQMIDAVPFEPAGGTTVGQIKRGDGITKAIFLNATMYAKLNQLIFATTGARRIEREADAFGNYVEKYRGCILNKVEQSGTGVTTLDYDEDPGDGTSDTASAYCVAFGEGLVMGLYNNGGSGVMGGDGEEVPLLIQVHTFGSVDTIGTEADPRVKTRFEGSYGLTVDHPRAVSRLYAVTNT